MTEPEQLTALTALGIFHNLVADPVGKVLGTGFFRFESPMGIDGLVKLNGDGFEVLAVVAKRPGNGQFRKFIRQCQKRTQSIFVMHDINLIVGPALERYDFKPYVRTEPDGEIVEGWKWEAK